MSAPREGLGALLRSYEWRTAPRLSIHAFKEGSDVSVCGSMRRSAVPQLVRYETPGHQCYRCCGSITAGWRHS